MKNDPSVLFKEAIADARAVRKTAMANAKVALEESFTEKYQKMFADKLKEEAGVIAPEDCPPTPPEDRHPALEETDATPQDIDDLLKELESEIPSDDAAEIPSDDAAAEIPSPEAGADEVPTTPEVAPSNTATVSPDGTTVKISAEIPITPEAGAGEVPGSEIPGAEGEELPQTDVPSPEVDDKAMEEEIDLDELLQTLKEEIEETDAKKEETEETIDEEKKLASSGIGGKTGGSDNKKPSASASSSSKLESGGVKSQGVPEGKVGPSDATEASRPNKAKNATSTNLSTPSKGGESGPALKAARPNSKGDFENTPTLKEENETLKKQLNEAVETVTFIQGQLNEVNLLNAKLLYTNKLFKEFNMNNEQKMRIIEMFDRSKDVREVKLTYANVAETINFGASGQKKKSSAVQNITEGLASKQVASTKPAAKKEIISESNSFAERMKKLANIRG